MTAAKLPTKKRARHRVLLGISIFLILCTLALAVVSPVPDLQVYRFGAEAWLHGLPLYNPTPPKLVDFGLAYTYPPISAVLFAPLALLPLRLGSVLLAAMGLLSLVGSAIVVSRRGRAYLPGALAAAAFAAIFFDPVRTTFMAGQINLVLMGLVVADCLIRRPRWPRGVLIGIAAAIKLTPAVFILYLLARRQWRAAATAAGTFAVVSAIGFTVAPTDSLDYWLRTVVHTDRIGPNVWPINQSLHGVLARFGLEGGSLTLVWLGLAAAVLALGFHCARRVRNDAVALLLVASAGLLASPISWTHHWVWIAIAAPVLWRLVRRKRVALLTTWVIALFAVFIIGMPYQMTMLSDPGTGWTITEHLYGDSYALVGLAFLVSATLATRRRPTVKPTATGTAAAQPERTPAPLGGPVR